MNEEYIYGISENEVQSRGWVVITIDEFGIDTDFHS